MGWFCVSDDGCCGHAGLCLLVLQPEREGVCFQYVERVEVSTLLFVLSFVCRAVLRSLDVPSSWHVSLGLFSIVEVARVAWQRWLGLIAKRCGVFWAAWGLCVVAL